MGRQQKYPVRLTNEEREQLRVITRTGKQSARVMQRAQILLTAATITQTLGLNYLLQ